MNKQQMWLAPETVAADAAAVDAAGYESLVVVLKRAFLQASQGKGKERHAQGAPFDKQPMQSLIDLYGPGFALGQAAKKMQEAQRLPHDRAVAELLGAINYIAGAVINMEAAHRPPVAAMAHANDNVPRAGCSEECITLNQCKRASDCAMGAGQANDNALNVKIAYPDGAKIEVHAPEVSFSSCRKLGCVFPRCGGDCEYHA